MIHDPETPPTDDLGRMLLAWGRAAVADQERAPGFTVVPVLAPARRRRRVAILASVLTVVVLAGTVTLFAALRDDGRSPTITAAGDARTPPPQCADNMKSGQVTEQLQSLPPTVGFALTYSGAKPCTIDARAPGLRLVGPNGQTIAQQQAASDGAAKTLTMQPRDQLTFVIKSFLNCLSGPPGNYTLEVYLGTIRPGHSTPIAVGELMSSGPFRGCHNPGIGIVTDLQT